VLTALDGGRKETGHRYPAFLPDGDHFLFATLPGANGVFQIFAASLTNPQTRTLIGSMESAPIYAAPGWLLFTRQGVLAAQPFDAQRLRLTGDVAALGDLPDVAPGGAAYDAGHRVSASLAGSLAYFQQSSGNTTVQWMDFTGTTTGSVSAPPARYSYVALAPDQTKAVLVRSDSATSSSLWLVDLARGSAMPLWKGTGKTPSPVWSPDSTRIVFAGDRDGRRALYEKTVTDASAERLILQIDDSSLAAQDWTKDGIVFNRADPQLKWNIYRMPVSGSDAPLPLVRGSAIEIGGWASPDNQWLAYLSDEAGHLDLYVQSLRDGGHRTQVAAGGIQKGWWTPDGRHLLYTKRDQTLWRVDVDLRATAPRIDAPVRLAAFPSTLVAMDLAADGRRFLALVPERAGVGAVTIVQSWRAALPGRR
jgi:Tol biopolymer transport system component